MSDEHLTQEEMLNVDYTPRQKSWLEPSVHFKKGTYCYSAPPKHQAYVDLLSYRIILLLIVDDERDRLPASQAETGLTYLGAAVSHGVYQGRQYPCAARTYGVTQGHGPAIGVPFLHIDLDALVFQLLYHCEILAGKGFVAFDDAYIFDG